nr:putative ribonuclease H-like domain-containing protein [Tanacetum cinerariifolium]
MKDLGNLKYFLGIEVLRSPKGIFICQKKYILDLLAEVGMVNCKPDDMPTMENQKLFMEENTELVNKTRYQRLVGKLIYLTHTRPDIAYAVGVVSRFMHQPQAAHMDAVIRIISYLKGTAGHGILFGSNGHLDIQIYTDADWAGDKDKRRSTSGYFSLVGGNLVTWRSKKQKVVALSSTEAEFRGIANGVAEALWIRKLVSEIGFSPHKSTQIMCDNKAAIQISENPVQHDRTKHVEVNRHFIKEKLEAGIIELPFVRSTDQLADILTKAVGTEMFFKCLGKLNFGNPTTQLEGECWKERLTGSGGKHMMADTVAGNSKDSTQSCQSVKKRLTWVDLWSPQAELAFENLQHAMVTSLVLALPKFEEVFVTATDGHPIAYLSKTLALKHQSLSTYEKELLDVILALQK